MAKFLKGIYGAYTEKVGNVIGSSWPNVDDVKSLPKQRSTKNNIFFCCFLIDQSKNNIGIATDKTIVYGKSNFLKEFT